MSAGLLDKTARAGKKIIRYLNLFARGLEIVISVIVLFAVIVQIASLVSALENLLTVIGIAIVVLLNLTLKYFKRKMKEGKLDDEFHMLK